MEFVSATDTAGFATALGANVKAGVSSLWLILIVALGIPIAFAILRYIISLVKHGVGKSK